MIYIAGRPMHDFTLDITERGGSVTLRLDDRKDETYWLEITLNAEELHPFVIAHYRERVAKEMGVDITDVEITSVPGDELVVLNKGRGPVLIPPPSDN